MSHSIRLRDGRGERSVGHEQLPLAAGGNAAADLHLPGCAAPTAFLLGVRDGTPFLQLEADTGVTVTVNGQVPDGSAWLRDGDVIAVDRTLVHCTFDAQALEFAVAGAAENTLPPVLPVADSSADVVHSPALHDMDFSDAQVIEATTFERPDLTAVSVSQRRRIWPVPVAIGMGVLAFVAWFLFTARAVQVFVEPLAETMAIEGSPLVFRLGERYLVRPGEYTVKAELAGYVPSSEVIQVGEAPSQEFTILLEKLPGILALQSQPADAEVLIDGVSAGAAPLAGVELRPGVHRLRLRAPRYLDYETELDIEGGGVEQSLQVQLEPNWAPLQVRSMPSGAEILVDGEVAGVSPQSIDVDAGSREISLRLAGHKTWRTRVTVTAGEALQLPDVSLQKSDGRVSIRSEPAGAAVTVDGKYRGQTPLNLALAPGRSYALNLSRAGFEPAQRAVRVVAGEDAGVLIALQPLMGSVRVIARPEDAMVYVDGQAVGTAGSSLSLSAEPHRIEVRRSGYETHSVTVTPRAGLEQEISVSLKTEAEAREAARKERITTSAGQQMRLVAPGSYLAGASRREQGRRANEAQFQVELTRHFYIGTHEVSNQQYRAWSGKHSSGKKGPYDLNGDRQPVVNITWEQAARYCNWLSTKESLPPVYQELDGKLVATQPLGRGYRLPTEAEWAWVARFSGGTADERKFSWGNEFPPTGAAGNYGDQAARQLVAAPVEGYDDGHVVSAPVGSFDANPLGIFDLGGNVAEWVHDFYSIYVDDGSGSVVDPAGPAEGEFHVIRGSGYQHGGIGPLRLSYRDYGAIARGDVGFRIARFAD